MMPKLIALDLDETTLDQNSRLSPENRAALEAALSRGVDILVATGRSMATVPREIRDFPGIRYAITGNGAAIYDLQTGQAIQRYLLAPEAVLRILELTAGEHLTYEAFLNGDAYAQADYIRHPEEFMADAQTRTYVQATRNPVPDILDFIRQHAAELDSLDVVAGDPETKRRVMERLQQVDEVYITSSVSRLVELSDQHCGKHRALAHMASLLGIDRADTAAFGNADNDAEMLYWSGCGVAVANASPACLAAADYVTAASWENGVAQAFSRLFDIL